MSGQDNNSTRKLDIEFFTKPNGSRWIQVLFLKYPTVTPRWIPSLRDLHRILQALAVCEDEKYPWPARGRYQLVDFLKDAVLNPDYAELALKYKIPEYDRDVLVKTNGAAVGARAPQGSQDQLALQPLTDDDINWG